MAGGKIQKPLNSPDALGGHNERGKSIKQGSWKDIKKGVA